MMKRIAYIWRKSIYDNDYRCNKCGAELYDPEKGKLIKNNVRITHFLSDVEVYCRKCMNHVAHVTEIDYDGTETRLGEWKGEM